MVTMDVAKEGAQVGHRWGGVAGCGGSSGERRWQRWWQWWWQWPWWPWWPWWQQDGSGSPWHDLAPRAGAGSLGWFSCAESEGHWG